MWILLGDAQSSVRLHRRLALMQQFPPTLLFSPTPSAGVYKQHAEVDLVQGMFAQGQELPENVHLVSLEQRYGSDNATVLRLQHIFEAGEDGGAHLAQPVTVDVGALIDPARMPVTKMTEMSLSANLPRTEVAKERLTWKTVTDAEGGVERDETGGAGAAEQKTEELTYAVQLAARQIKTFLLNADADI
jgi:hypothetical protein